MLDSRWVAAGVAVVALSLTGCFSSSTTPPKAGSSENTKGAAAALGGSTTTGSLELSPRAKEAADEYDRLSAKYPDVPRVELTAEVDGVKIRRYEPREAASIKLREPIPADVGNDSAQGGGEPVTGGRITIRFDAEPKTLNPITESSANQTYISAYTMDGLAMMNPETLEWEPKLAESWATEDSVKLSADYPGQIRRLKLGETTAGTLELSVKEAKTPYTFETVDEAGKPIGNTWVGFFAAEPEKMSGAPTNGLHIWSDAAGKLEVAIPTSGKYRVHVGAEIYGQTVRAEDGTLTVTPLSKENPLNEQLKEGEKALTLKPTEYTDVQRETVLTFQIRKDARWSDGEPFTGRDLEFTLAAINNHLVDGEPIRTYYADVIECKSLTPHVVRMRYREQYFLAKEFLYQLPLYGPPFHFFEKAFRNQGKELTLAPLTAEQEQAQKKVSVGGGEFAKFFNQDSRYNDRPLGTGPYIIESWIRQDRVILKRNPNYWDTKHGGYLDEIVVRFIPDDTTALQELRAGGLDFHYRLTPEQYFQDLVPEPDWFRGKYVKADWYTPAYSYVGWNGLEDKFRDPRVRMAFAMLFNTDEWIRTKLHGAAVPVSGSQYIFGKGYDHSVMPIGYDPEAAVELLNKAGWIDSNGDGVLDRNGLPFRFTMSMPTGKAINEQQLAVLQKEIKQVGIDMQIQLIEWASFLEKVHNKDFDACRLSWATSLEGDPYQLWHSSGAGVGKRSSNHVSFRNSQADQLIAMLRVTLDEEKRQLIHSSFHRILDREQPYLFLYAPKEFGVYHRKFRGVKWYPLRPGFDLREWWIAKNDQ